MATDSTESFDIGTLVEKIKIRIGRKQKVAVWQKIWHKQANNQRDLNDPLIKTTTHHCRTLTSHPYELFEIGTLVQKSKSRSVFATAPTSGVLYKKLAGFC